MNHKITLYKDFLKENEAINIPGSKSESNRSLIINALCDSPGSIDNLASARDTVTMLRCLKTKADVYDVMDAGTAMRFLTAYLAVTQNNVSITGTDRMKKRPIKILVDALSQIGTSISYLGHEGYPPLKFNGFNEQLEDKLSIASNISSQYISALLMVAPKLPRGLTLSLTGGTVSKPYIDMTIALMRHFGVTVEVSNGNYAVNPQTYTFKPFHVEPDWSAVSYWYSLFKLSDLESLFIAGVRSDSNQGDSVVAKMMTGFGVRTSFENGGIRLTRTNEHLPQELNFMECPDLAQTFAVICAGIGHRCYFTGLQTLKIKETDRVLALQKELEKFGADLKEQNERWELIPGIEPIANFSQLDFETYEDHRMAMAFAPLAVFTTVSFDDYTVVNKSYPSFWQDMEKIGFHIDGQNS